MTSAPEPSPADTWTPRTTLGDRFRMIRRGLGLSQIEFAAAIEENHKNYSTWEVDRAVPRRLVEIAKTIETKFAVPAPWTLGLDQQSVPNGPSGSKTRQFVARHLRLVGGTAHAEAAVTRPLAA